MNDLMDLGKVIDTHGLNGEIKVYPITHDVSNFLLLKKIYILDREYSVKSVRFIKNLVAFTLHGINDINTAQGLIGNFISIERKEAPPLESDEYYMIDIIGCLVYDDLGVIGNVIDIIETKSNDVYVIDGEKGIYKQQILLPAIKSVILNIDMSLKKIHAVIPKGLLDDEYF